MNEVYLQENVSIKRPKLDWVTRYELYTLCEQNNKNIWFYGQTYFVTIFTHTLFKNSKYY